MRNPIKPALPAMVAQAGALRNAGRHAESARVLEQAAQLAPREAAIQHDLGQAYLALGRAEAALACFDGAIALDPLLGLAHFRRGVALELLGRGGFIPAYGRAIELMPTLAHAYGCLASAHEQAGERSLALPLYREAARRAEPGSIACWMYIARAALIEDNLDRAEAALRAVLTIEPKMANARGTLAGVLNARGDFGAAEVELNRALTDKPGDVSLYYTLVQIRRLTAEDAPLIARMRAGLALGLRVPPRIRLHLALAKALDDTGDYAGAMAQIDAANVLRARTRRVDRAAVRDLTDRMIALPPPPRLAGPPGARGGLPVLVLGMPRSGTTLVEGILSSHPDVAGGGEVKFWDRLGSGLLARVEADGSGALAAAAGDYLARLEAIGRGAARVVDKNPFNYRWALLIHLALPEARIIHCRRHPAGTSLSIMMASLSPQLLFSAAREDLAFCYAEYLRLMAHLRGVLPPECFLEVEYEALVAEPEAQTRRMVAFCGLAWDAACLAPERNRRVVRTASVWQARQPLYGSSAERWRHYEAWLGEFVALA